VAEDDVVHRRFESWASRTPHAPAVVDGGTTLTYAELDALASTLATVLIERDVRVEDPVAVRVPRGFRAIAAFLAVLKAGGCYVPVDPDYPQARQDLMTSDCGAVTTLVAVDVDAAAAAVRPRRPRRVTGANLAYMVYTSGSTGKPKGVMVEHGNICAFVDEPRLRVRPGETVAQNVAIGFDVATFEIWGALTHGGCLVIIPDGRSVAELAAEIRRVRPDWMFLTAGVFHLVVQHDPSALAAVGTLQAGGDVLAPAHWCRAADEPRRGLFNAYGPSETTVYSALYRARPGELLTTVPIGTASVGEHLCLSDDGPEEGMGEILIGGCGVSRGYRDRPRLTAERFVPDPHSPLPGGRRYRSGDLGSIGPGGVFLMHGRIDRQVKVRGFRIELAELESVITGHPAVAQAAVTTFDVGAEKRLGAFAALAEPDSTTPAELLAWLRERLPAYMVPAHLHLLDEIPLDPNGKVHRAALPTVWSRRADMPDLDPYVPPASALAELLAGAWAETLQIDHVGADDNYFLLGGDSLRAISLLAALADLGIEVTAEEFLRHQTVAELAELVDVRTAVSPAGARAAS